MTYSQNAHTRIAAALDLARTGNFAEARNILEIVEMGGYTPGLRTPHDELTRAWATFGKLWRAQQ